MLRLSEISSNEIVKILAEDEGIEEEYFAIVNLNNESNLYVNYLSERNKFYKDACIYTFDDHTNEVEVESISEHYKGIKHISELGFIEVEEGWFVKETDIDSECSDSDIDDLSSEEDNDFIAEEDISQWQLPEDHAQVDNDWNTWRPQTEGERHYKDVINRIEQYANIYKDNMKF